MLTAQERMKALFEQGFHKPGDAKDKLGSYLGASARAAEAIEQRKPVLQ